MSETIEERIGRLYAHFNARNIDGVLGELTEDVAWANGMDGGHVHGKTAVRDYWQRQWAVVSPHVEPVEFTRDGQERVRVEVIQKVFDLDGRPLVGQDHGLTDKTVMHVFSLKDGQIARFDIEETA